MKDQNNQPSGKPDFMKLCESYKDRYNHIDINAVNAFVAGCERIWNDYVVPLQETAEAWAYLSKPEVSSRLTKPVNPTPSNIKSLEEIKEIAANKAGYMSYRSALDVNNAFDIDPLINKVAEVVASQFNQSEQINAELLEAIKSANEDIQSYQDGGDSKFIKDARNTLKEAITKAEQVK